MILVSAGSRVDGQTRNRVKSDFPGSRKSAGRCTLEVFNLFSLV